ncbi:Cmp/dcmp deaminase, zinc-binding protein [Pleurostoma richardsiae]|uniref:Cmp/dcmp deaminase, zinc-binding protein n=1 Tax=Pleurostoma richardsiae TaxID=41990 RepID=A0AA38RBR8_9PEZI|nr:Cmp/dcmp deaminase, zinc-binding protein [Pleurostoma richardsiae]
MASVNDSTGFFPPRTEPTQEQIDANMTKVLEVQHNAQTLHGKRPFAGILVGPDHTTVLLIHQSVSHVDHAEASLARLASLHFSQPYLWTCTMYSTWEPCAMCTATIYWANIGRVIYGASNDQLLDLTGRGNKENMTMSWTSREIVKGGQKEIEVVGPLEGWDKKVMEDADIYWSKTRK